MNLASGFGAEMRHYGPRDGSCARSDSRGLRGSTESHRDGDSRWRRGRAAGALSTGALQDVAFSPRYSSAHRAEVLQVVELAAVAAPPQKPIFFTPGTSDRRPHQTR